MQFTVLIEFLVPGLVTLVIGLALFYGGPCQSLPGSGSAYETINALLFIAIAYPVGILTNFVLYQPQKYCITPAVRRRTISRHLGQGIFDQHIEGVRSPSQLSRQRLQDIFGELEASVFRENIARFDSQYQFYESLQRLARGMVLPSILLSFWLHSVVAPWSALPFLGPVLLACLSIWLLCHSVQAGAELTVRFHIVTAGGRGAPKSEAKAANQPTAPEG
jgi:hypothetical protein